MGKIQSFTDLLAWQEAQKLAILTYQTTNTFPKDELYALTSQMRRAAVSVSSNIAEGFHRFSLKEKVQFYSIAVGSTAELHSQVLFAEKIGYIKPTRDQEFIAQIVATQKLTNGLIRSTRGRSL